MPYKDGVSDLFGNRIPVYPFVQRHKQGWVVRFNPDYHFLIGSEAEEAKAREFNENGVALEKQRQQVIAVLPKLRSARRRQILQLLLISRKTLSEIAERLNCSYANIHIHLYGDPRYQNSGAVAQLKQILKTKGGFQ